jgi:hypothetical protein
LVGDEKEEGLDANLFEKKNKKAKEKGEEKTQTNPRKTNQ